MRWLAALATLLLAAGFASGARAHAALVAVEPVGGSIVATAPKTVELRFDEVVTPGAVRLIDGAGRTRDDLRVGASGHTVSVELPPDLPEGTVVVSYRVVSQDGHPVAGSTMFSVGRPTATQSSARSDGGLNALIWLALVGLYLGLFAGVGGVVFARWIAGSTEGMTIPRMAIGIGLTGAVASLGLLGLDLLGLPMSALVTARPWTIAVTTSAGPAILIAIIAMLLAIAALRWERVGRLLAAIALVGVGASLAISGHAATAPPQMLMRSAVALHGIGAAFWIGALAPLAVRMAMPTAATLPVLSRFSHLALPVVGMLALTGLGLAIVQLGRLPALVETRYGLVLLTKLALVALLLGLAGLNRTRLVPALARSGKAAPALKRAIALECVLAVAILAVVAGWRFTPPPRTTEPTPPLALHIHTDKAMVQVAVVPGRPGLNDIELQLMTGEGAALTAKEVTLTLSLPARGIEAMELAAEPGPDGSWRIRKAALPVAGLWHLRIAVLVSDFAQIILEDELDLARP